ncbi:MAG: hypothetical protein QOJ65_2567, partial [Fimbriimonadaceae bacterium]|nr:hypothetical protein [Fimbriimonadaceae bacterium]
MSCRLSILFAFVFAVPVVALGEDASNFSGLKDQELKPLTGAVPSEAKDIKSINLADILAGLRSNQKKDKNLKINKVTVLEDRRTMMRVRIEYETAKTPLKLSAWTIGKNGHADEDIVSPPISLTEPSGEMEITLVHKAVAPERALPYETTALQFGVGSGSTLDTLVGGVGNGPAFLCAKKWQPNPNLVILKPFGLAATSPPSPAGGAYTAKPILTPYILESVTKTSASFTSVQSVIAADARPFQAHRIFKSRAVLDQPWVSGLTVGGGSAAPAGPAAPKGPGTMLVFSPKDFQSSAEPMTDDLPIVFQDAEPASGYYYYKPNRFALSWDNGGYSFKMIYGASGTEGAAKGVTLAARLKAPLSGNDLALIKKLIEESGNKVVALRPFPIGTPPTYNIVGALKSYGITPENVFITGASEQGDEMEVRIVTDALTKETLQTLMSEGLGLAGDVIFDSSKTGGGVDPVKVSIPAPMRFADVLSFGGHPVTRGADNAAPFTNDTPYPVMLEYVNVLKISGTDRIVYNYSAGPIELMPGEKVNVDPSALPAWMDTDP